MDKERLTTLYNRICLFNKSEDRNLEEARSIKQEAYDICMTEGANTDNYKKLPLSETFYSARTEMQCIFNALSEDVSFMDRYKIDWNGFRFAEGEMKTAFERDLFDKRWDWDEIGRQLDDFFRSIKPDPEIVYREYVKDRPWLDKVTMTDDDLKECLTRDIGQKRAEKVCNCHYRPPYDRVQLNILKHLYETGEQKYVGDGYIDGQNDELFMEIMESGKFRTWQHK